MFRHIVEFAGKTYERKSPRDYRFVILCRNNEAHELKDVTDILTSDVSNAKYYADTVGGRTQYAQIDCHDGTGRTNQVKFAGLGWVDDQAQNLERIMRMKREHFEEFKAKGGYSTHFVVRWSQTAINATKALAYFKGQACYTDVEMVTIQQHVEVKSKTKREELI